MCSAKDSRVLRRSTDSHRIWHSSRAAINPTLARADMLLWTPPRSPDICPIRGVGTTSWFLEPVSTAVRGSPVLCGQIPHRLGIEPHVWRCCGELEILYVRVYFFLQGTRGVTICAVIFPPLPPAITCRLRSKRAASEMELCLYAEAQSAWQNIINLFTLDP